MNNTFNPKNSRVKMAHQKRILNNPPVVASLILVFLALLVAGIVLLYFKYPFGWTLIGFAVLPAMFVFWIKNALNVIPIRKSQEVTDLLSESLLLLLSPKTTPADLGKILAKTDSGPFLMARYGLPIPFFEQLSGSLPADMSPIYDRARTIQEKTNSRPAASCR